jgi:pyrimidine operon attenuation protein/uracil phosphoribosyltransferase
MNLPDAEKLFESLVARLKGHVTPDTGIVGIVTGGAWLAERLHRALGLKTPLGVLDPSFYRDDFSKSGLHHQVKPSQIPFEVEARGILLVDDVLYTGRTVRGAMNELFDYGRPARIDLAVLIDRGGRELPVAARYVGASLEVPPGKVLVLDRGPAGGLSLTLSDTRRRRTPPDATRGPT